jgi:hypothetical protein
MSSFSTRLSLKRPDGSDPFLRQDYVDNLNKLDAAPGIHICTSSGLPSWGSNENGRLVYETDTDRLMRWNGTAFVEPAYGPKAYSAAITYSGITQGESVAINRAIANITVARATNITGVLTVRWNVRTGDYQSLGVQASVNGTTVGPAGVVDQIGPGSTNLVNTSVVPFRASLASPGTYAVGFTGTTGAPSGVVATIDIQAATFVCIGTQ